MTQENMIRNEGEITMPLGLTENKSLFIPENSILLYTSPQNYKIWSAKVHMNGQQVFYFYVSDSMGNIYDPIVKKFSQLKKRTGFDFFFDLVGDFDVANIAAIKAAFMDKKDTLSPIDSPDKCAFEAIYKDLCGLRNYQYEDVISLDQMEGKTYLNIEPKIFGVLVKKQEWGWQALDIKKNLRLYGLLRCNEGRVYDFSIRNKNGRNYRAISILLVNEAEVMGA